MSDENTSSEEDDDSEHLNHSSVQSMWVPRNILRRTNWLYRVDALRNHDMREMRMLWDVCSLCERYATQFIAWAYSIKAIINISIDSNIISKFDRILSIITKLIEMFWSEGYCYFLDFLRIAYYPVTNRFTRSNNGPRFPIISRTRISMLGHSEAMQLTGFSFHQLQLLFKHLRIPEILRERDRYKFRGEEAFMHYMVYNRLGETKLRMSQNYFGGDPRRFTYSIRLISKHIYTTFYHKISGDSMRMWANKIPQFQYAIWNKLRHGATVEETVHNESVRSDVDSFIFLGIPLNSFRIFGFLDDTGFRTTAPGRERNRNIGFFDDIQRSFYSGYFAGHGFKVQALTLPNGMFGSIYLASLRVSDSGLLNMSGLDNYLSSLFRELNISMINAFDQYPAVYGDGIFPQLCTIVARYSSPNASENRINVRMSSVRQSIEHIFALHKNTFDLFNIAARFRLMQGGVECYMLVFNSFFLLNCYVCLNESPNNFDLRPPSLE